MADPVVGTLLIPGGRGGFFTQDLGTGVVTPGQPIGEKRGRFFPGCGHSIMSWELRYLAVAGVVKGIILCPVCWYVQRIANRSEVDNGEYVIG